MARSSDPDVMRMGDALEAADIANVHTIDEWDVIAAAIMLDGAIPPPEESAIWDVLPGSGGDLNLRHKPTTRRLKPSSGANWGTDWAPCLLDMAARLNDTTEAPVIWEP